MATPVGQIPKGAPPKSPPPGGRSPTPRGLSGTPDTISSGGGGEPPAKRGYIRGILGFFSGIVSSIVSMFKNIFFCCFDEQEEIPAPPVGDGPPPPQPPPVPSPNPEDDLPKPLPAHEPIRDPGLRKKVAFLETFEKLSIAQKKIIYCQIGAEVNASRWLPGWVRQRPSDEQAGIAEVERNPSVLEKYVSLP